MFTCSLYNHVQIQMNSDGSHYIIMWPLRFLFGLQCICRTRKVLHIKFLYSKPLELWRNGKLMIMWIKPWIPSALDRPYWLVMGSVWFCSGFCPLEGKNSDECFAILSVKSARVCDRDWIKEYCVCCITAWYITELQHTMSSVTLGPSEANTFNYQKYST